MAIRPGYRRLKEFDYLTELDEEARESLDIPENAVVIKIIDKFREGGPIGVAYTIPTTEEQRQKNRERAQNAVREMQDAMVDRYNSDPEFRAKFDKEYGICS